MEAPHLLPSPESPAYLFRQESNVPAPSGAWSWGDSRLTPRPALSVGLAQVSPAWPSGCGWGPASCSRAVFQKVEDQWKLVSYYREEDFFLAVSRLVTEDTTAEELPEITVWLLTRYCGNYLKMMQHRESFNSGEVGYRTSDHPYDRQAAASYAAQYCLTRNSAYTNYDELGGNNQNFVSQVLRAGGIPNDTTGNWKWKYYGDDVDETERAAGRTPSWVGAYYFYNYAISNYDSGLASTVGANFFAAEGGDVLMTGPEKDLFNTSYVVLSTCEEDGAVFEILLGSNSVDRENWPMTACFAPYVTMIKVQGWKD